MPVYPFGKSVGGGRSTKLLARIKLPTALTGEQTAKSLVDMLYGTETERRTITNATNTLENTGNFGTIEEVELSSTGTNTLRGRLYYPTPRTALNQPLTRGRLIVLFCSGSGGSAEDYGEPIANYYTSQGIKFLAVNYRGFGRSGDKFSIGKGKGGTPSESGLYDDAYYMYKYLKGKGYQIGNIIVHGFSLGGPVAASLVKTQAKKGKYFRALVLESPMITSYEAAADSADEAIDGTAATVTKLMMGSFDTRDKLRKIRANRAQLPIRLCSGGYNAGDQLDIAARLCNPQNATSFLADVQAMNFSDMQSARAGAADHMNSAAHMQAADGILQGIF